MKWTKKLMDLALDDEMFPDCIECGQHYFHHEDCKRGRDPKDWDMIYSRLNDRLKIVEKKHGTGGDGLECKHCQNIAAGRMHILYHGSGKTVEDWPVCMDHAFYEDSSGRESQFRGF